MRHVPQTSIITHSELTKGQQIKYETYCTPRGDPYTVITRLTREIQQMFHISEEDAEWIVLHIEEALGIR